MSQAEHSLTIQRLRLRARPGQQIAQQMRVEHLLGSADLLPAGLPSGLVLIIDTLRIRLDLRALVMPHAQVEAFRQHIARCYHAAARPAAGGAAPSQPYVAFADHAELLAALARDMADGSVTQRWYWRAILGPGTARPGHAMAQLWQQHAYALPAAIAQLGSAAVRAVAMLPREEIATVAAALDAAYRLTSTNTPPSDAASAPAPWRQWLAPPAPAQLAPAAERLLGTALALWHAPQLARSQGFAAQAAAWQAAQVGVGRPEQTHLPSAARPPGPKQEPRPPAAQSAPPAAEAMPTMAAEAAPPTAYEGVATRLGGILYLINLLGELGWPSYAPDPGGPATIGGWRLLALLARAMLPAAPAADPLWAALEQLAPPPEGGYPPADAAQEAWLHAQLRLVGDLLMARLDEQDRERSYAHLRVPGRLVAGPTHVDMFMALDSIDIAVRRVGLDRDPGWVAELGRLVLFHYD